LGRRAVARLDDERLCWSVLGAAMAVYVATVVYIGRDTTLFVDEVDLFTVSDGLDPESLLAPLNGHLELLLRLAYAGLFGLVGADDFTPIQLLHALGAILAAAVFFALVKERLGPAAALPLTLLLLFLGSAWEITFIESGFTHVWCLAAGLAALLALERDDRRGEVAACVLLVAAISAFTYGIAFAIGAGVLIWRRGRGRRALWVALVPLALYAAWLVWVRAVYVPEHGEAQTFELANLLVVPNFVANEAAAVAGALTGLDYPFGVEGIDSVFGTSSIYGPLLALLAAGALGLRLRRGEVSPFLWAAIALLLAVWCALALGYGPGRNPTTVRYVYAGSALAMLVGAEAARQRRLSRTAVLAIFAVCALALAGNIARLRDGAAYYRTHSLEFRAELTAIEIARDQVAPDFLPDASGTLIGFPALPAEEYFDAVARNGSPAFTENALLDQGEGVQAAVDEALIRALGLELAPTADDATRADCRSFVGGSPATVRIAPAGVSVRSASGGAVSLARFAQGTSSPVGELVPGRRAELELPADESEVAWRMVLSSPGGEVEICPLPEGS